MQQYISLWSPQVYFPRLDYFMMWGWTSWFLSSPLKQLLEELIDFEYINCPAAPCLMVGVTNVEKGCIEYFTNKSDLDNRRNPCKSFRIDADCIVASASYPPFMPMTPVGSAYYWDGGLYSNSFVGPILDILSNSDKIDPAVENEIFMVNLWPNSNSIPRYMTQVMERKFEIEFQNKFVYDKDEWVKFMKHFDTLREIQNFIEKTRSIDTDRETDRKRKFLDTASYQYLKRLASWKPIIIPRQGSEDVWSAMNWSAPAIKRLIEAGYCAAQDTLRPSTGSRSTPSSPQPDNAPMVAIRW